MAKNRRPISTPLLKINPAQFAAWLTGGQPGGLFAENASQLMGALTRLGSGTVDEVGSHLYGDEPRPRAQARRENGRVVRGLGDLEEAGFLEIVGERNGQSIYKIRPHKVPARPKRFEERNAYVAVLEDKVEKLEAELAAVRQNADDLQSQLNAILLAPTGADDGLGQDGSV